MTIPEKYYIPLLLLVCLGIFFPHLDVLYENIMEARNFITAREMLHHDNWLLTTLNGEPRYEKPPLPTWLAAISAGIFGLDAIWALRLPSALIATFWVLVVYRFSFSLLRNKTQAFHSSLILATSFYIIFAGRNGTWDIFAHAFMMLGIYFLWKFFRQENSNYTNALLAGLGIGLSFLSKGPVSHYALLLPFLIAYGIIYGVKGAGKKWKPALLLIVTAVLLGGWWLAYVYINDPGGMSSIADKETTAWANRNLRPFYYYWSFFAQSGIWTIFALMGLIYPYMSKRVADKTAYKFTFTWTVAVVVLLSLIPEKKSRYLLPVLVPLAMNTGFYVQYLTTLSRNFKAKWERWPIFIFFGIIITCCILVPGAILYLFVDQDAFSWVWFVLLQLAMIQIAVFGVKSFRKANWKNLFYLTILFVVSLITFGLPFAKGFFTNPEFEKLAPVVQDYLEADKPLYVFDSGSPELIWDMGQRLPAIRHRGGTTVPQEKPFYVLVESGRLETFAAFFADYEIEKLQTIDGNITVPEDRNYKTRRIGTIFRLTEK
ncbi:MAG: glycosyltransferase family 39 protein [Leeuwenhoekiella sp.]